MQNSFIKGKRNSTVTNQRQPYVSIDPNVKETTNGSSFYEALALIDQ